MTDPATDPVGAIALLDEPKRRRLYEFVTSRREPVGRDEAAAALGIGRELAAFHLDRLAAAGLLATEFKRLGGRTGPGAGRPAKLYRRSETEVSLSLPARDYERAAEVFADALEQLEAIGAKVAIDDVAHARGQEAGRGARAKAGPRAGTRGLREALVEVLGDSGFEPTVEDPGAPGAAIRLQSCPYHALAATHRDLTCGMNLAWAEGVLEGLDGSARAGLEAELRPEPGWCCVVFRDAAAET
ncbi:MAG TPA: hypothetical protein VNH13_07190 [Candidatus Acidoferrales bacterium]|nr:hypothetical protein [Candidatus Acidoferrales bacterium]